MATVASIRNTADLSDKFYEDEDLFISGEFAKLAPFMAKVNKAIVKSKFRSQLEEEFGNILFRDAEMSIRLTTSRNVPLSITENKLRNEYSKAVGLCSTDFRGEKCNFYGLLKHMESTDRDERREAFEAWAKMYEEVSPKLDKIYDNFLKMADQKKEVNDDDLLVLAGVERTANDHIKLDYLQVTTGMGVRSVASIGLDIAGEKFEAAASGNGPVDAAIKALKTIIRRNMTIKEFTIQNITKGSDDIGKVHMQVESDGRVYYGFGANTDIITASVEAYIDCINKFKKTADEHTV